jgi:hypothetical protein
MAARRGAIAAGRRVAAEGGWGSQRYWGGAREGSGEADRGQVAGREAAAAGRRKEAWG